MKRILAFVLILILIMSQTACTKKKDEPDDAVIVDNDTDTDITDDNQAEKPEKEEPVIYDDSNATPASSFEYTINDSDEIVIDKFIGKEKNVVIYIYG